MPLNYSRRTILSFQILTYFCSIFGIIPLYNFHEKRFPRPKLFKSYLALIALVMIAAEVDTVLKIYKIGDRFDLTHLTAVVGDLLGMLIWSTALYQACFKRDVWESMFTELDELEGVKNLNTAAMRQKNVMMNNNFQMVCVIALVLSVFAYEQIWFMGEAKRVFLFNTSYIYFFLHFWMAAIIGNMALVLKHKFEGINILLESYESEPTLTLMKGTRKIKELYAAMSEVVDKFNDIFGPQLFLMGLHCSSQILQFSVSLVYIIFPPDGHVPHISPTRLMLGITYIILMLIWLGVTMFCCDTAVVESDEIFNICYRIQLKYSVFSDPYQSIRNLLYLVHNSKIKFTAMDYYEINRSTMFELIGSTATYFVVLIQFYDPNKDSKKH